MPSKLVTAAADYPLTLDEVKGPMRIDDSDHDLELISLIAANTAYAESFTGRALVDQTWDVYLDEFPSDAIKIPYPPTIQIVGVFYRAAGGDEQELDAASYELDVASEPGRLVPVYASSWPTISKFTNSVRVRFRAGYVDFDASPIGSVPEDIKNAIILRMKADYDQGDDADRLRAAADVLLRRHRVHTGMA